LTESGIKIGVDARSDLFYAARVEYSTGRPEVKALLRFEKTHLLSHQLLQGGRIIFSIPDQEVIIKKIQINKYSADRDVCIRFELCSLLMEQEENLYFDSIPGLKENSYIGLVIRKQEYEKQLRDIFGGALEHFPETGGEMRAAALGRGFINFCRFDGGDLICLADFNGSMVSLAFIYRKEIIDLSYLSLKQVNLQNAEGIAKAAVELKTLLNFKLASFFDDGITVPLSGLIMLGDEIDGGALDIFKRFFNIPITKPEINRGFLTRQSSDNDIPLDKYLVALGLAVK